MRKKPSSPELSLVGRINAAQDAYNQSDPSAVSSKESFNTAKTQPINPLLNLLASSAEFLTFAYSPALKSLIRSSENAKTILGTKDEIITGNGNLLLRHVHIDDRFQLLKDLESALEGKAPLRTTYRWIRPDRNEMRWLHCRASISSDSSHNSIFEGIILDISDLVGLESKLAKLQRTESLRLLSAGVGHHFNNALQAIVGHATIVNSHPDNSDLVKNSSESIIEISLNAAEITRKLFSNIEKSSAPLCPVDANMALSEATNKVKDLFNSGFEISLIQKQIPLILGNKESLCSVFEAVLSNARDAMNKKTNHRHKLCIKTGAFELEQDEVGQLPKGNYVKIVISDSGIGMDPKTLAHCLDPFFTTKDPDSLSGINLQGAGLGLSKAFSTIRSLGGTIKVDSNKPQGSCVEIFLPAEPSQFTKQSNEAVQISTNEPLCKSPRILLVDDDEIITFTIQSMLRGLNEECVVANNAAGALDLMRRFGDSIDLVLLDVILPTSDSSIILRRLKEIKPSAKIIGFSGAAPEQTKILLEAGALEIVNKPVQISALKNLIEKYLEAPISHAACD